jgi:hypothetical protein
MDYEESVSQLTTTLLKTFELLHKHGDSEKGIYLSGGVDSALMAVLSREILEGPVHTYTLYGSEDAPDFNYARKVAKAIGSEHHELFVTSSDYLNELPNFIYHYENLVAGGVFDIQGGTAFLIKWLLPVKGLMNYLVGTTGFIPIPWVFPTESGKGHLCSRLNLKQGNLLRTSFLALKMKEFTERICLTS